MIKPLAGTVHDRWTAWESQRHGLLDALAEAHGTHSEDDVLMRIANGEYRIWHHKSAIIVTFFIQFPQFNALNVFLGAGNLEALLEMEPHIALWAAQQGCKRVVGGGRAGWMRTLPGYERGGIMMYKDL